MDPFPAYRIALKESIYIGVVPDFYIQLNICAALCAISLAAAVGSVGVRVWRSQFWLFRLTQTTYGRLISPHPVIGWCISNSIFLLLFQGYISVTKGSTVPGTNLHGIIWWRTMIWFPLWFSAWIQAWSTSVAPFTLITRQSKGRFDIGRYPILINTFFIGIPALLLIGLLPLIYESGKNYDHTFSLYPVLDGLFAKASATLATSGDVTSILAEVAVVSAEMSASTAQLAIWWRRCWIVWTVATITLMAVFGIASWDYFRSLLKSMTTTREQSATSTASQGNQLKALNGAYKSLLMTTIAVFVTGVFYLATDLMLVIGMDQIMAGGPIDTIVTLLSVWTFSILGTFSNIIILVRSISTQAIPGTRQSSFSSTISSSISTIRRKLSAGSIESKESKISVSTVQDTVSQSTITVLTLSKWARKEKPVSDEKEMV